MGYARHLDPTAFGHPRRAHHHPHFSRRRRNLRARLAACPAVAQPVGDTITAASSGLPEHRQLLAQPAHGPFTPGMIVGDALKLLAITVLIAQPTRRYRHGKILPGSAAS